MQFQLADLSVKQLHDLQRVWRRYGLLLDGHAQLLEGAKLERVFKRELLQFYSEVQRILSAGNIASYFLPPVSSAFCGLAIDRRLVADFVKAKESVGERIAFSRYLECAGLILSSAITLKNTGELNLNLMSCGVLDPGALVSADAARAINRYIRGDQVGGVESLRGYAFVDFDRVFRPTTLQKIVYAYDWSQSENFNLRKIGHHRRELPRNSGPKVRRLIVGKKKKKNKDRVAAKEKKNGTS